MSSSSHFVYMYVFCHILKRGCKKLLKQRQFHVRALWNTSYVVVVVHIFPLFPSYFVISFLSCFCTLLSASGGMFIIFKNETSLTLSAQLIDFSVCILKQNIFNPWIFMSQLLYVVHTHKRVGSNSGGRWRRSFFFKTL